MATIKSKYGSGGNFKLVIKLPTIAIILTLIDVNCKDEIDQFMIQNFNLNKVDALWVYDPDYKNE